MDCVVAVFVNETLTLFVFSSGCLVSTVLVALVVVPTDDGLCCCCPTLCFRASLCCFALANNKTSFALKVDVDET